MSSRSIQRKDPTRPSANWAPPDAKEDTGKVARQEQFGKAQSEMKVLLQRVNRASVRVADETVGEIGRGVLLLVGFGSQDTDRALRPFAEKIVQMRIFPEADRNFHKSLLEIGGEVLLVPQFTLYADTSRGRRPEFSAALKAERATEFFDRFVEFFRELKVANVQTGRFGADMKVTLENDGPVTLILEPGNTLEIQV